MFFWKWNKRTFHAAAHSSVWFPPSLYLVPKQRPKIYSPLGNQGLTAYQGWEKWQATKQIWLPKFPVLIFLLACTRWLTTWFSGRAEGRISDAFSKSMQIPSPTLLRAHNFALNCISEVRNSECCQGLFKP